MTKTGTGRCRRVNEMKIIMTGALGRMGQEVCAVLGEELACGVDAAGEIKKIDDYTGEADGIIDFSFHGAIDSKSRQGNPRVFLGQYVDWYRRAL